MTELEDQDDPRDPQFECGLCGEFFPEIMVDEEDGLCPSCSDSVQGWR